MTGAALLLTTIFEPGFFSSEPVRTALVVGGGAAIVSGAVGVFTVMRGQSFAGHALADIASAGGSASLLFGVNPLLGFLIMAGFGAAGIELAQARSLRERDLATAVAFAAGLALTALFLHLDMSSTTASGAAVTIMFGSMFSISASLVPLVLVVSFLVLAATLALYRPLLLSSLDADLAAVRGVWVRTMGFAHLLALGFAVALSALTVGAVLSTALVVGPAASALRLVRRPAAALALAPLIGLGATWGGVLLAYDSYDWTGGRSWPVSFFTVVLIFAFWILARPPRAREPAPRLRDKDAGGR